MRYLKDDLFGYDNSGNPLHIVEIAGASGETKPTSGIVDGSEFIETDTGKRFVYDEATSAWAEMVVATAEVGASE